MWNRRNVIAAAAAAAALPWLRRGVIPTAVASDVPLLVHADMEVSSFDYYSTYGDSSKLKLRASGNAPVISDERARVGSRAARVYLNRNTSPTSFRTEAEAFGTQMSFQFRRTYWIGFSIFVPSSWAISNTWEVLFQLHNRPLDWKLPLDFSPVLAIRLLPSSDQWRLVQRYVQAPEGKQAQSDLRTAFDELHGQVARGKWTDWVIEYRPDWRTLSDGGAGVTRIWRDGTRVVNYTGPNCVNETNGPYLKFGCYKSAWNDRAHSDPVVERLYFYDEVRVSQPDAGSFDLVSPGGPSSVTQPNPPSITRVE